MKRYLVFFVILLFVSAPALAHNIKISAYAESGVVYVAGHYPDDRPVKKGRVLIHDSSDTLLLKGKTDEQGKFSFPIPKLDRIKITVSDQLGHRSQVFLRKSILESAHGPQD